MMMIAHACMYFTYTVVALDTPLVLPTFSSFWTTPLVAIVIAYYMYTHT